MSEFILENHYISLFKQHNPDYKNKKIILAGVDEAGRGPLAGPVVASAVIFDENYFIPGIKDSKKLSKKQREDLYAKITTHYTYSVSVISHEVIDQINILEATKLACINAIKNLPIKPDIVIVDGNMKFQDKSFISIIKGDHLSYIIGMSSIVAKISRDKIMTDLSYNHPEYAWDANCGYGTKKHIDAIRNYGFSTYHRNSFKISELH